MSKYFQTGLVLLYVVLTAFTFLLVLELSGVPISDTTGLLVMAGWSSLCFSSAYFSADFVLFRHFNVRKPVLAEEEKLQNCLREILQRAHCDKQFRLRIEENLGFNAFAIGHNTIVISRGMLEQMTEGEIKGVMAHELGHLQSKDCIVGSAFVMAGKLPQIVGYVYHKGKLILRIGIRLSYILTRLISAWLGLAVLFLMGYFIYRKHLIRPIFSVAVFVLLFTVLDRVFNFFGLMISRFTEYKQDAYAHHLGYGAELRQALHKLAEGGAQRVNRYIILMTGSHPVIHNRIRRLEKLEGLR